MSDVKTLLMDVISIICSVKVTDRSDCNEKRGTEDIADDTKEIEDFSFNEPSTSSSVLCKAHAGAILDHSLCKEGWKVCTFVTSIRT